MKTSLGPVLPAFLSASDHSIWSISTELGEAPFTVTALKSRFEPDLPRNPSSGEAVLVKFPNANTFDMCCLRGTDLPHLQINRRKAKSQTFSKSFQKRRPLDFLRPPQNHPGIPYISWSILKFPFNYYYLCFLQKSHKQGEWQLARDRKLKGRRHHEIERIKKFKFLYAWRLLGGSFFFPKGVAN